MLSAADLPCCSLSDLEADLICLVCSLRWPHSTHVMQAMKEQYVYDMSDLVNGLGGLVGLLLGSSLLSITEGFISLLSRFFPAALRGRLQD